MRTHVILSDELVAEIDRLVGKRKRSRFAEEAIKDKLRRAALTVALKESAGILAGQGPEEWDTPEGTARWVRQLRAEDNKRLERKSRGPASRG
ncbi:MAG: hypothetical protein HYX92_12420 [Chloroflexi bacterium]|nr:hypothetical protein [Chloroflexota bacterium]